MGFEKYEKGSFGGASEPVVSIRQSGTIGLSKATMEEHFEGQSGAILYFDEDANRMGIEPADPDDDPDAYVINSSQGSGSVQAEAFLKDYDLVPDETTSYEIEWSDDHGFVVVKLDEPVR